MARKNKIDYLDFSRNQPSWARAEAARLDKRRNAIAKADAFIAEEKKQGGAFSTEDRESIIQQLIDTGEFSLEQPIENPAPVLPAKEAEESFRILPSAIANLLPIKGVREAAESLTARAKKSWIEETIGDLKGEKYGAFTHEQNQKLVNPDYRPTLADIRSIKETKEELEKRSADRDLEISALESQRSSLEQEALAAEGKLPSGVARITRVVGEGIGRPSQQLPVAAGLAGGLVGGYLSGGTLAGPAAAASASLGALPLAKDSFEESYVEAIEQLKATPEEAGQYAALITGIEFGTEALGGASAGLFSLGKKALGVKSLTKGAVKDALTKKITGRLARTAGGTTAEMLSEQAAEFGGEAARNVMEAAGSLSGEESKRLLAQRNAQDAVSRLDRALDTTISAVAQTGPIAGIGAHLSYAADAGKQHAETLQRALEEGKAAIAKKPAALKPSVESDIYFEEQEAQKRADVDRAFTSREAEAKASVQRKGLEEEAGFQTMEKLREFGQPERVEEYAGVLERTPIQPPAEVPPGQIAQRREAAAKAEAERLERVELVNDVELLRKADDKVKKQQEATAKKEEKKAVKRRSDVAAAVAKEFPEASQEEKVRLFRERMSTPVKTPQKAEEKTAKTIAPKEEQSRQKTPIRAISDKELAGRDVEIADLAKQLNLGMRETLSLQKPAAEKKGATKGDYFVSGLTYDEAKYVADTAQIVKGLVKANRKNTADVQNLIRQGKLKLVPNAESVGRTASNNTAEFDPNTGEMFLFTDKMKDKDAVSVMAAALHEATHAGQFNDREGRPSLLRHIMDNDGFAKANRTIYKAAQSGNKLAKAAVAKAEKAAAAVAKAVDEETGKQVAELEIVPYFITEATKARKGTFGQLRGVANDVVSSARVFLREKLGVDLEVSLKDIAAAAKGVAGEIVKTDVKPAEGDSLGMILGPTAKGFKQAKAEGRTYRGARDRGERFEIPDNEAELAIDDGEKLLAGKYTKLSEVLPHPKLYDEYPWLADYKAVFDDQGTSYGSHSTRGNTIHVNSTLLRSALHATNPQTRTSSVDRIRRTLLHEAQHAIQNKEGFLSGANPKNFIPATAMDKIATARNKYETIIRSFDFGRAVETLPIDTKRIWENEVKASGAENREALTTLFLEEGYADDSKDQLIRRVGKNFASAREALDVAENEFSDVERRAFETYLREYGETEARNTELRSRMTDEQLKARAPEETMEEADGSVPVDMTLDTTGLAFERKPAPDSQSIDETLGMAGEAAYGRRYVPAWISGLFDQAQGTGKQVNELVEFARSSPAQARMIAEGQLFRYNSALNKLAAQRNTTPEALNEEISRRLDVVDSKSDSYDDNHKAFANVIRDYGNAGEALLKLRDQIDDLTFDILKQRAAQGKSLSDKEKKLYSTLLNNLGRYSHRQYAANSGAIGQQYSTSVWKAYEKEKKGKGSAKTAKGYVRVAEAVKYLVDENLNIPEDLSNIGAAQARSLYETWIGPSAGVALNDIKSELEVARAKLTPERLERQAESTVRELLGLVPQVGAVASYYRGSKQDNTILKERTHIPPVLRELMGEITDPGMRLMLTAGKQAEFVARNRMLLDLSNESSKDIQPPDAAGTKVVEDNKMTKLEGEMWGPMEGYYVSPNMRNLIGDTVQQLATFEQAIAMAGHKPSVLSEQAVTKGLGAWGKIAGVTKGLQIIWNPVNFLYNFAGAPRMLLSNGNYNPKNVVKALKSSTDIIAAVMNPASASEEAVRLNKYGVTDSAFIGDLKQSEYRQLRALVKEMSGKKSSEAMLWLKQKGVGVKETYAMMDVWSKVANFYNQVEVLTDFYKKNGEKRTAEEIDREAADNVNRTNITYKRAAPLVKAMERSGLTMFGPYFYEVFRSEVSNTMQGIQELKRAKSAKTPEARNAMLLQGTKRLTGQALAWTLTANAVRLLSSMGANMFGDDEEEKAAKALLPDYLQNQEFMIVGKDKDGNDVMFNLSRLDPVGPMTDIIRSAMAGDDADSIQKSVFDLYIAPRAGTQILKAIATMTSRDERPWREPLVQQQFPDAYSGLLRAASTAGLEDRQTKAWTNVAETFLPGIVNSYRDTNVTPVPKDIDSTVAAALTYVGGSMYKLDPKKAAKNPSYEYGDVLKNARKDIKEIFDDHPEGLPQEELMSRLTELRQKEKAAFDKTKDVYEGMLAHKLSPREAQAVFKEAKLQKAAIKDLAAGGFQSRIISEDSLNTYMRNELVAKSIAEKREIKAKWKTVMETLGAAKKELDKEQE